MNRVQMDTYRNPDDVEVPEKNGFGGFTIHRWGGWEWTHEGIDYRTNREGDGLFHRRQSTGEWVQDRGTCQFSLPRERQKALRILRREGLSPDVVA